MTEEEFFEDTWGNRMSKEEFVKEAVARAADHFDKDLVRKAAQWVADNDGPERRNFPRVSSLAATFANEQPGAKTLWPVNPLSPEASVRSDDLERWARPWAEAIRQALFKQAAAPFATLEDAITWIEGDSAKYARKAQARAKRLTAWQRQTRQSAEGLADYGFEVEAGITRLTIGYPKDGSMAAVPANSPTLHRLARAVRAIAQATGWTEIQTILYLLVKGWKPAVPRYTLQTWLKTATSPQGTGRLREYTELTLYSAYLSFVELRHLYKALQQHGVAKKKPLTKRAQGVWQFAEERKSRMKWTEMLKEWNDTHKKLERYESLRGFRKAWERVETVKTAKH